MSKFIDLPEREKSMIIDAINALEHFAERPNNQMDDYQCHKGLCDKYECGRCGRAIHAYGALMSLELWLADIEKQTDDVYEPWQDEYHCRDTKED